MICMATPYIFLSGKLVAIRLLNNYVNLAQVKAEFGSLDSALGPFDKNLLSIFKTEKKLDFPKFSRKKSQSLGSCTSVLSFTKFCFHNFHQELSIADLDGRVLNLVESRF